MFSVVQRLPGLAGFLVQLAGLLDGLLAQLARLLVQPAGLFVSLAKIGRGPVTVMTTLRLYSMLS